MAKATTTKSLAALALREALPGKSDHDLVELKLSSIRTMLESMAALAISLGRDEGYAAAIRLGEDTKAPLYGVSSALDGLADSVDTLMQTIPTRADEVIAEMIRCVMARVDLAADELDRKVIAIKAKIGPAGEGENGGGA